MENIVITSDGTMEGLTVIDPATGQALEDVSEIRLVITPLEEPSFIEVVMRWPLTHAKIESDFPQFLARYDLHKPKPTVIDQ